MDCLEEFESFIRPQKNNPYPLISTDEAWDKYKKWLEDVGKGIVKKFVDKDSAQILVDLEYSDAIVKEFNPSVWFPKQGFNFFHLQCIYTFATMRRNDMQSNSKLKGKNVKKGWPSIDFTCEMPDYLFDSKSPIWDFYQSAMKENWDSKKKLVRDDMRDIGWKRSYVRALHCKGINVQEIYTLMWLAMTYLRTMIPNS